MINTSKVEQKLPPKTLYKYYPVADFLPKILNGESLRFTCPFDFNDPFESHFGSRFEDSVVGRRYFRDSTKEVINSLKLSPSNKVIAKQKLLRVGMGLQTTSGDNSNSRTVIENIGVFSLSEVRNSTLMWSHYAKAHEGICIGFDTRNSLFQEARDVRYQDALPVVIQPADDDDNVHRKSVLTKALCWEYEKEWRIVWYMTEHLKRVRELSTQPVLEDPQLIANGIGAGDYKFPKTAISEIYLGARIKDKQRAKVLQAIKDAGLNIRVYEIQVNRTQYRLDFRQYGTQSEWRAL